MSCEYIPLAAAAVTVICIVFLAKSDHPARRTKNSDGLFTRIKAAWVYIVSGIPPSPADIQRPYSPLDNTLPTGESAELAALPHSFPSASSIGRLWNYGSEAEWNQALNRYYEFLSDSTKEIEYYMENVDSGEIARLPAADFYVFLHDKYFVWKYTQKNRLATTRNSLRRYTEEDRLDELADIQRRLFSAEHSDITECMRTAAEIHGLGPAGASGLLAILFPEDFGTADQFVVKALRNIGNLPFKTELERMNPDSLSVKNAVLLIEIMRTKANELNERFSTDFWTPRKIDMILWAWER